MSDLFTKFNRYGVVKLPGWFPLVIAWEARYWILSIGAAASVRRSPDAARLLGGEGVPWLHLALEVPVLLLAFAAMNRDPNCGAFLRGVWRRGREVVAIAAALNIAWIGWHLMQVTHWKPMPDNLLVLGGVIDVLVTVAVWTAAGSKELFSEFPAPPPPPQP